MKKHSQVFLLFIATLIVSQAGYNALAGVYCSNGAGVGAVACKTVATGCDPTTPPGSKCDLSGVTNWCECDRNWSGSVWFCGCDWII